MNIVEIHWVSIIPYLLNNYMISFYMFVLQHSGLALAGSGSPLNDGSEWRERGGGRGPNYIVHV